MNQRWLEKPYHQDEIFTERYWDAMARLEQNISQDELANALEEVAEILRRGEGADILYHYKMRVLNFVDDVRIQVQSGLADAANTIANEEM